MEAEWNPRRELALPTELLYKILLVAITDSVHSICVSTEDTPWERSIMDTLHRVSRTFKAISTDIAGKAFDIQKTIRQDDARMLRTSREIFIYLSHLGTRLRSSSEWGSVSFQTIDCTASSLVFAYALYLSCISLRRNASRSPPDVFQTTHKVILSALAQSEALCERVYPVEVTIPLRCCIAQEFELARHGLVIVQSFADLHNHAISMMILQPSSSADGTGPTAAVRSMIHTSLLKVEAVYERYTSVITEKSPLPEPRIYELPTVLCAIRLLAALKFEEDEYNLEPRLKKIVDLWSVGCPFLNPLNAKRSEDRAVM
ncbi:hypothetical protein CVT25_008280 [Psilocybe cyanescens]|uniref:Uncharacterized protein n=1 Tax=Psilocybe cyanescens TaxID=93625 RepID=A0A409XJL1_PSICY|nr:hypothetical protein CVT25_008280 [Psilocybe cyanescens]